ncbi:MAG: diversity-generating retroelement protein Avd [Bacteroidota bacterium]
MKKPATAMDEDLPVFVHWMGFLDWLLDATEKFPKHVRFTISTRIENLALDIVENLVEARYAREKSAILQRANLRLEKIRVLLRISHDRQYLSRKGYLHAMKAVKETGRMLGGWIKQQETR